MPKVKQTRGARAARRKQEEEVEDADLTLAQWKKVPTQVLRLKCLDLNILATGKNPELAQRLYDKYHPVEPNPPVDVDLGDEEAQVSDVEEPTIEYTDDRELLDDNANDNNDNNADPLFPEEHVDDQTETTEDQLNTNTAEQRTNIDPKNLMEMIQEVVENSLQGLVEENSLLDAQVKALRSKLEHMDRQQRAAQAKTATATTATTPSRTATPKPQLQQNVKRALTSTNQRTASNNNTQNDNAATAGASRTRNQQQQGIQGNQFVHFSTDTANNLENTNTKINQNRAKNPFRVAALDAKVITAIENGDYIDFDKIKKKKLDEKSRQQSASGMAIKIKEHDSEEGTTLSLNRAKKDMINSFTEWMEVWNAFLHTRLHFQPQEAFQLLSYQKHITAFAKKYKWEAVRAYDIDFRHYIANERSEAPIDRDFHWEHQNTDLKNHHLHNQEIPPPTCFNCTNVGHKSSDCPQPSKRRNSGQAQGTGNTNFTIGKGSSRNSNNSNQQTNSFLSGANQQRPQKAPLTAANCCRGYNSTGDCPRAFRCRWHHNCNKCGKEHPGIRCDEHTSTDFIPAGP